MATVRLSDAYVHDVYGSYTAVDNIEKSGFFTSGVIATNPLMDGIAKGGGKLSTVPAWADIDPTLEPNYSNDDPADLAVPNKIGSLTMTARKAWVNQAFSAMNLVTELAGSDPMQRIRNRFGVYWTRQLNRRLIAMCKGVLADNVANDSSDMTVDISAASAPADQIFNKDAFVDATYGMGEYANNLNAIAVHSNIKARMVKNDDVITIHDSELKINIDTYMGARIIEDNTLGFTGSGAARVYTSIVFGGGAIGWGGAEGHEFALGEGVPAVPHEMWRNPAGGNGGGEEQIWERNTWLMHPFGFDWIEDPSGTDDDLAEFSPTIADLVKAVHWNRKVAREQVPMAFIKSKA